MKTLIEIHALQNFAPSNLNRDDTGAPKDALFGGTRRARVSSQCLKRAVREHFKGLVKQNELAFDDVAYRTKRVLDAIVAALVKNNRPETEAADRARLALAAMELTVKDDGKSEYLLFLGQREISGVADIIHEKWDTITPSVAPPDEGKKPGKAKKQAALSADPELKKALEKVFDGGKAVDVALFGRMLADMPEKNQNAACQVAHAISTHAVEREFDFYTAVDDCPRWRWPAAHRGVLGRAERPVPAAARGSSPLPDPGDPHRRGDRVHVPDANGEGASIHLAVC